MGIYSVRDNNRTSVDNLPPQLSGNVPQDFNTHYIRAGWDYTLTPNLLNHINLGYNRTNSLNYAETIAARTMLRRQELETSLRMPSL